MVQPDVTTARMDLTNYFPSVGGANANPSCFRLLISELRFMYRISCKLWGLNRDKMVSIMIRPEVVIAFLILLLNWIGENKDWFKLILKWLISHYFTSVANQLSAYRNWWSNTDWIWSSGQNTWRIPQTDLHTFRV